MNYIKLMRPKHYLKNILIFIPLIFSGLFLKENNFWIVGFGFCYFSLIASVIYILNDLKDYEKDKKHHIKKERPIASGKISVKQAILEIIILLLVAISMMIVQKPPLLSIFLVGIYLVLNIGYSFGLKNIPLLDILILVLGFVMRVLFGASLLNIKVSNWLYLTIIAISFYLGLGKRRNEMKNHGMNSRKVLKYYQEGFLDKNMYMFLTMAIIFYSLWATDQQVVKANHNLLIWTIPLVIIICMRYSMIIEGDSDGDPIEVILKDKTIIILTTIMMIVLFTILYIV